MPSLSRLSESGWPSNVGPFQLWTFGVLFFDNQIDLNKYGLVLYWARWLVYPTQFCLLQLAMVLQCPIWRNDHGSFNWKCRILNRRPPPRKAPCTELHALSYNTFPNVINFFNSLATDSLVEKCVNAGHTCRWLRYTHRSRYSDVAACEDRNSCVSFQLCWHFGATFAFTF